MNLNDLHNRLIGAARKSPPSDATPYAFERRVMNRLATRWPETALDWWSVSLWRGAIACVAVTLLCGLWSYKSHQAPVDVSGDFSQEFSSTVFASMDQTGEGNW
jgi:hypothetical protein